MTTRPPVHPHHDRLRSIPALLGLHLLPHEKYGVADASDDGWPVGLLEALRRPLDVVRVEAGTTDGIGLAGFIGVERGRIYPTSQDIHGHDDLKCAGPPAGGDAKGTTPMRGYGQHVRFWRATW